MDCVRVSWESVLEWAPEILIVMPCGLPLDQAVAQTSHLAALPGWERIPAAREGRIYAVDANSYFARPGPRVVEGTHLLASLFYPELVSWNGPATAFRAAP